MTPLLCRRNSTLLSYWYLSVACCLSHSTTTTFAFQVVPRSFRAVSRFATSSSRTTAATVSFAAFFTTMDSSGEPSVLSRNELRRRRLQALGGSNDAVTATTTSSAASAVARATEPAASRKRPASTSVAKRPAAAAASDVIDLCDDSDDDDDDIESTRNSKRPAVASAPKASRDDYDFLDSSDDDEDMKLAKQLSMPPRAVARPFASIAAAPTPPEPPRESLCVATYNVWFGPQADGLPCPDRRMAALVKELLQLSDSAQQPVLIGLQEVVTALLPGLKAPLQAAGYKLWVQPGIEYGYGCAVAVKVRGPGALTVLDATWQDYRDTTQRRGFWAVRARYSNSPDGQVLFCTSHLESWTGKGSTGAVQRRRQLQEMEAHCNQELQSIGSLQAAIITGDLNWDDERRNPNDNVMATVLQNEWVDAWLQTRRGPRDTCYTYDGKLNPMLGNNLRRRFDRILIRSKSDTLLAPVDTLLVGTKALPGLSFEKENPYTKTSRTYPVAPSDHFGLVAQLRTTG